VSHFLILMLTHHNDVKMNILGINESQGKNYPSLRVDYHFDYAYFVAKQVPL
jgi:hypothetical protein